MTDPTTQTNAAVTAAGDLNRAVPAPFPEQYRKIFQELAADANVLLTKIEGTRAMTGATRSIENAKSALLAFASHLYAHFDELNVKAEAEGLEPTLAQAINSASTTGA